MSLLETSSFVLVTGLLAKIIATCASGPQPIYHPGDLGRAIWGACDDVSKRSNACT